VLTMTGYFAASEPGDLYYFTQHHRYNPHADHMLLIGPYDDAMMQLGHRPVCMVIKSTQPRAVDFRELRYQWFDQSSGVLQRRLVDGQRPTTQVMGANEWQHAASLDAMAGKSLRFYLDGVRGRVTHRLTQQKKTNDAFVQQTVSFVDRTDAAWTPSQISSAGASRRVTAPFTSVSR